MHVFRQVHICCVAVSGLPVSIALAHQQLPYDVDVLQVEMIASQEGDTPGVCSIGINEAMNVDVSQSTQLSQVRTTL